MTRTASNLQPATDDIDERQQTARHDAALVALLNHPTVREAAEAAGLSEATLHRYLGDPAFVTQYRAARRQVVEVAIARLQQDAAHAAGVLRDVADDTRAPATARVAAARAILGEAMRGIELLDLQARVDLLEQAAEAQKGAGQ